MEGLTMKKLFIFAAVAFMIANCSNPVNNNPDSGEDTTAIHDETGYIIIQGKGGNFCNPDTVHFMPGEYRMFSLNLSEPEPFDTTKWIESREAICNFEQGFITFENCGRNYRIMLFK